VLDAEELSVGQHISAGCSVPVQRAWDRRASRYFMAQPAQTQLKTAGRSPPGRGKFELEEQRPPRPAQQPDPVQVHTEALPCHSLLRSAEPSPCLIDFSVVAFDSHFQLFLDISFARSPRLGIDDLLLRLRKTSIAVLACEGHVGIHGVGAQCRALPLVPRVPVLIPHLPALDQSAFDTEPRGGIAAAAAATPASLSAASASAATASLPSSSTSTTARAIADPTAAADYGFTSSTARSHGGPAPISARTASVSASRPSVCSASEPRSECARPLCHRGARWEDVAGHQAQERNQAQDQDWMSNVSKKADKGMWPPHNTLKTWLSRLERHAHAFLSMSCSCSRKIVYRDRL
jgi:hypothetical protein